MKTITISFFLLLIISCFNDYNVLKVSPLFSNGAVLQRNTQVSIWGEAVPNSDIKIFSEWGQEVKIKSNTDGSWIGKLSTPDAGGPFYLKINSAKETLIIRDLLIGEVWLASGQSNMEMTLTGYPPNDSILNYRYEIKNANYSKIRMFNVEKHFSNKPRRELKGVWLDASPSNVKQFSATAYFFAREIHTNLDVPVGIIHSSWAGSPCEAWVSENKLTEIGLFQEVLYKIKNSTPKSTIDRWFNNFRSIDIPKQTHPFDRLENQYEKIDFSDNALSTFELNDKNWEEVILPGRFDSLISEEFDGVVWLRKDIYIDDVSIDYSLNIGYIDDMDKTYINGNFIGGLSGWGYWNQKRQHKISKSLLSQGKNTICIRAIDLMGPGRIEGEMNLSNHFGETIPLDGRWKYKPVAELYENKFYIYDKNISISKRPSFLKTNAFIPTVLFNGMIYPIIPFTIKGAIWYQGEANVGRHDQYNELFPGMIEDWRKRWGETFPFYFVQIAPFKYNADPKMNISQKLRDSQRKSQKVPKTGMVVTLDIGDYTNIHPANKQEVGMRLARLALVNNYNSDLNPLGPILINSSSVNGGVRLDFSNVGSGLVLKMNKGNEFEIANNMMEFVEAEVSVDMNYLILSSQKIKNPKYVRYAWSDTPEATLFNGDGFPASSLMLEIK